MFTGIIKEIGTVKRVSRRGKGAEIEIACKQVGRELALGDSVAVNGVCLTLVKKGDTLCFNAVGNTMDRTVLADLRAGSKVNLEEALRVGDPMGGHMVAGHVDGTRRVRTSRNTSKGWLLEIGLVSGDEKYLIDKGSVAIDGVSLTVGELLPRSMKIYLIPHTLEKCTLGKKRPGDKVNVEFDTMGKYSMKKQNGGITLESLRDKGMI